jgi:hypothetical protein
MLYLRRIKEGKLRERRRTYRVRPILEGQTTLQGAASAALPGVQHGPFETVSGDLI